MECSLHEGRISCQICSHFANFLSKKVAYFNNMIVITFNLANMGRHVNQCSIVLNQLLVELICQIKHQKKATTNPISSKTKANNYYSKHIQDIMFRKWFPLSEVPSPRIVTHKNLCHQPAKNDKFPNNDKFHLNLL